MVLDLTCLALSAALGTASPQTVVRAPAVIAVDSAQSLLTVESLAGMTKFWSNFMKNTPDVRDTGRQQNQETLMIPLGKVSGVQTPPSLQTKVVNMVAMAAKFPTVAENFKQAGMTPEQWEQTRSALFSAFMTNQIDAGGKETGDGSVLWKNVAFLRAHQTELQALQATGMYLPKVQMQAGGGGGGGGGGGDDLSP